MYIRLRLEFVRSISSSDPVIWSDKGRSLTFLKRFDGVILARVVILSVMFYFTEDNGDQNSLYMSDLKWPVACALLLTFIGALLYSRASKLFEQEREDYFGARPSD